MAPGWALSKVVERATFDVAASLGGYSTLVFYSFLRLLAAVGRPSALVHCALHAARSVERDIWDSLLELLRTCRAISFSRSSSARLLFSRFLLISGFIP